MLANCLFQIRQLCQLPRFIIYFIFIIIFFFSYCQKSFYVISVCHAFLRGCCIFSPPPLFYSTRWGGLHSVHLLKRCIFVFFWSLPVAIFVCFFLKLCGVQRSFFLFSLLYYREGLTYSACRAKRLEIETPGLEKVIELVFSQQAF